MSKPIGTPEIIYDPSARPPRKRGSSSEPGTFGNKLENEEMDIQKILKDIEHLAASHMPWKDRKKYENERMVSLGGKPQKKQRVPLSVGKQQFKNQKKRELKLMEEEQILGKFIKRPTIDHKEMRKTENRALKASEGHFSRGVLDVKHLLKSKPSEYNNDNGFQKMTDKGKRKGNGKGKKKGKGKGKGKKRRH